MTVMNHIPRPLVAIIAGTAIAAALAFIFLFRFADPVPINIITDHHDITARDYQDFMARREFDHPDHGALFANGVVTRQTIPFLNHLAMQYRELPEPGRTKAVNDAIIGLLGPGDRGDAMLEIARLHLANQREEAKHRIRWFSERDMEKVLVNLREMQDARRARFGRERADILFGTEIKSLEYTLRKHAITTDKKMPGREKEKRLTSLRKSMWGNEAATIDSWQTPAQRCGEKIALYENDFRDLDEDERLKRIRQIRLEFFPLDEVKRMEAADRRSAIARRRDREYYRRSRPILEDRDITDAEKSELLMNLQHEIYGSPGGAGIR